MYIPNAMQLLAEQLMVGDVTSIRIDSTTGPRLSLLNDRMYVLVFSSKNPTVSNSRYQLYFNNDTTNAHYTTEELSGSGGAVTSSRLANTSELLFLEAGVTGWAIATIIIDVDGNVRWLVNNSRQNLANVNVQALGGVYIPVAPGDVNRIDITGTIASSIAANSVARLYRVSLI